MQSISLRNPSGHAIEIRRGPGRHILVRHSHLAPEEFGIFRDPDALARVFQRHGLGTDPELGAALRELERVRTNRSTAPKRPDALTSGPRDD